MGYEQIELNHYGCPLSVCMGYSMFHLWWDLEKFFEKIGSLARFGHGEIPLFTPRPPPAYCQARGEGIGHW